MARHHRHRASAATKGLSQRQIIAAAAAKWHVPFWILYGVKVAETGSTGSGIGATSSAGAQGPFQFIPSTAAAYHVDVNSFTSSADGAAHYLHDLKRENGSWEAALQHYSGGGYGLQHVGEKAAEGGVAKGTSAASQLGGAVNVGLFEELFGKGGAGKLGENLVNPFHFQPFAPGGPKAEGPENPLSGSHGLLAPLEPLQQAGSAIVKIIQMLTDINFWIRVGEGVGGLILIYMGLHALTGSGPGVADTAKSAAAVATVK
jgi:hypothetical protein